MFSSDVSSLSVSNMAAIDILKETGFYFAKTRGSELMRMLTDRFRSRQSEISDEIKRLF